MMGKAMLLFRKKQWFNGFQKHFRPDHVQHFGKNNKQFVGVLLISQKKIKVIKTEFTIRDLENLSDVKAHTIRIWEKRYNLLEPNRTDTNIRRYDLDNLKKLLNITYLYKAGHKISKLADMSPAQIAALIEKITETNSAEYNLDILKTAMLEFEGEKFDATLREMLEHMSFEEVYFNVFIPLLKDAGILWHSGTIEPSHEHFISEKIKQSIIQEWGRLEKANRKDKRFFVLFLPEEEMHEISILFANYKLLLHGFKTIYLGANIPLHSLKSIQKYKENITFISCFTVQPERENIPRYLDQFFGTLKDPELWIVGDIGKDINSSTGRIKNFVNIKNFNKYLQEI